jgi:dethiobiotin synthetase
VVLVADAGLGTINAVRLSVYALRRLPSAVIVVLNRFDAMSELYMRNLGWLRGRDGLRVAMFPGSEPELADLVRG